MSTRTYRVAQWSTGNVGMCALRGIIRHPRLELAGLWVHSEQKAGRDAGELAGLDPVGVTATNDPDEILGLDADAVCYTATADLRPQEAADDLARILESGKNVVSSSIVPLVFPPAADDGIVAQLQAACEKGGTSCFTSGIDPGFANDLLPIILTGFVERIDSVRVSEILNYATYDQPEVLFQTMGFGQALDATPLLLLPGVLQMAWGPVVEMIAAALDVELEEVREVHERVPAPETFTIIPGTVDEGTTAGLRFEVQGIVGGRPAIVVEHVTRLRDDIAPEWPQPSGKGSYRIVVEGSPRMKMELEMEGEDGDENTAGLVTTAMRILNAVPAVCVAEPGLVTPLDLPLITGAGLLSR
ncbi:MAG: diacylglycerol kinase [Acidimicrobiia bacterium]|nr:diacylglycerol kinase [Acidimicrobiia bacterium]